MALNDANAFYNTGIQMHQDRINSIQQRLLEEVIFHTGGVNCMIPKKDTSQTIGEYSNIVFNSHYYSQFLTDYFTDVERNSLIGGEFTT